jgi:hypothetical protein
MHILPWIMKIYPLHALLTLILSRHVNLLKKTEVYVSISPKVDSYCKPVDYKVDTPYEVPVETCNQPIDLCVPPSKVQLRIKEFFKPLKMHPILNSYPPMFFDYLPMFKGDHHITVEKHMESFDDFVDNFEIMHEDVILRLFSKSLVGDATLWFINLKACSIFSWIDFHLVFLRYWGENKYVDQYSIEINSMRRGKEESLATFNIRFQFFYYSMALEIWPSETTSMVYYTLAQHHELFLYLRERKSSSLEQMFTNVEEIEENFQVYGRLPKPFWDESFEQSKDYEQHESDLDVDQLEEGYGQEDVYEHKSYLGQLFASFSDFNSFLGLEIDKYDFSTNENADLYAHKLY